MSDFKLNVDLEQYTPLLHFQGDQSGACLRASEVKPKLDRFVMAWLVKYCDKDKIPFSWTHEDAEGKYIENAENKVRWTHEDAKGKYIENAENKVRRTSLRYKMKFAGTAKKNEIKWNEKDQKSGQGGIHKLYFGAMGDESFEADGKSKIKAVPYSDMSMEILCTVQGTVTVGESEMTLIQVLEKLIPPFFALHCFGTRSNKGFGSFGVTKLNGNEQKDLGPDDLKDYIPERALYYVQYGATQEDTTYLDDVSAISAVMKAGFNYGSGAYAPGFVREYSGFGGYRSEKAQIKRDLLSCRCEDERVKKLYHKELAPPDAEFLYKRAMLGVAGKFEYRNNKKVGGSRNGTVDVDGKKIKRFGNPIHYKPYGQYLLLIPQSIPDAMLGAKFAMSAYGKKVEVSAPEQFDVVEFMNCFVAYYKNERKTLIGKLENSYIRPAKDMKRSLIRCKSINSVEVTKNG